MLKILVAGGFDETKKDQLESAQAFARILGIEVIEQKHTLLNGCRTSFDKAVAEGAKERLDELQKSEPSKKLEQRLISYVLADHQPIHTLGDILRSQLKDWELTGNDLFVPEQIELANAVILVGGFQGTHRAANWARISRTPLLPLTLFGGAAEKIYYQELGKFDTRYGGSIERSEYENLNQVTSDFGGLARTVISLAEKLSVSRKVFVIMSFSDNPELEDLYDSFRSVCTAEGYECKRVDDDSDVPRIIPEICERIKGCAFTIVDLSVNSPNVFYELGYAEGLSKPLIVTAKEGTVLPFDVKDIPTIFWRNQKQLKEALAKKIQAISRRQDRRI